MDVHYGFEPTHSSSLPPRPTITEVRHARDMGYAEGETCNRNGCAGIIVQLNLGRSAKRTSGKRRVARIGIPTC